MESEVRVHLRLGSLRLDYEGEQSFYEKHVETLVASAAVNTQRLRAKVPGATPALDAPPPAPPAAAPAPAHAAPPHAAADAPRASSRPPPAGFVPQSGEFGRFVRKVQGQAQQPDQQVTAFAFYLWNYEQKQAFTAAEIEGCFKALGFPVPDLPSILTDLTDRKRFLESASGSSWRLSRKGENYVKTRLLAA
jgi:hypothetical protein